jgi:hypothetical protein
MNLQKKKPFCNNDELTAIKKMSFHMKSPLDGFVNLAVSFISTIIMAEQCHWPWMYNMCHLKKDCIASLC